MSALSNYLENKVVDWLFRAQTYSPPATLYVGLILATKGAWVASTAYSVGDTVIPTSGNGHLYKCTTAGTSGSTEPSWPTTNSATVTDGSAVWTEEYADLESGTVTEPSTGGYARVAVTSGLTEWAGTQAAGSTTASSGTNGTTSNNAAITFPSASAAEGEAFGFGIWDASTSGNMLIHAALTTPQNISSGATASFAAGALTVQIDD